MKPVGLKRTRGIHGKGCLICHSVMKRELRGLDLGKHPEFHIAESGRRLDRWQADAGDREDSMANIQRQVDRGFDDDTAEFMDWVCDPDCGCSENLDHYQPTVRFPIMREALKRAS